MGSPAPDEALRIMKQAMRQSGRQEFVTSCLFRLWPHSRDLLLEVSRRLGDEIRRPGDRLSLLGRSIRTGYDHFSSRHRSKRERYRLDDWDGSVFFEFFYGLYWQASEVSCCRVVSADGAIWTVQGPPYIAWRRRHGGEILINWHDGGDLNRTALRLAWQTMLAYRKQRLWIERRLLEALGRVAHGGV